MCWLTNKYMSAFKNLTGSSPSKEERNFIYKIFDTEKETSGKKIYYDAVFLFKRWVPQKIIMFILAKKMNTLFRDSDAPESFILLSNDFAEMTFEAAKRRYCNSKD